MAEFNLTPVFRMEMFIDAIMNGTTPPEPKFREEFYFAKVAGMDVELPTPITRREFYLAKYAGMNVDLPVPVTRDEMYLALACGLGVEPPEPVFRDEYWLYELSGGGRWSWKTVSGTLLHITDALASPVKELSVAVDSSAGVTGCSIWRTGKNLFDKTNLRSDENRYVNKDGVVISPSGSTQWRISGIIRVKAGETYTLSNYQNTNTGAPGVRYYDAEWNGVQGFAYGSTRIKTFTIPDGVIGMVISVMYNLLDSCQLEVRQTATDHEDYQGTTTSISWQTEAGSITSGTLTIDENGGVTLETGGVTHQLQSITSITLLAGENNVWADCGDTTLTYQAVPETAFSDNADTGMADYMTLTE